MIVYFYSFFFTLKSAMINKKFYEDSKLICILKFDFFLKLISIFKSDFFQNPKLICLLIKYRSDFFFQKSFFFCYKSADFEIQKKELRF